MPAIASTNSTAIEESASWSGVRCPNRLTSPASGMIAKPMKHMVAVMSDLTDLFYFRAEGAVTSESLQAHMARFRGLAETTVF